MDALNLTGKTAVVLGIANRWSIAYAIANTLQAHGARLAVTYQNERVKDDVYKLTSDWPGVLLLPCELTEDSAIDAVRDFASRLSHGSRYQRLFAHCRGPALRTLDARGGQHHYPDLHG